MIGDGDINNGDVVCLVNHILGIHDENFIIENADVNNDGDLNVTDVTTLVNIILNGGYNIQNVVIDGADGITFGGVGSTSPSADF